MLALPSAWMSKPASPPSPPPWGCTPRAATHTRDADDDVDDAAPKNRGAEPAPVSVTREFNPCGPVWGAKHPRSARARAAPRATSPHPLLWRALALQRDVWAPVLSNAEGGCGARGCLRMPPWARRGPGGGVRAAL
eukprot:scaffold1254_cov376-Prasinococcus_capsulatus_cf.AAC.4